MTDRIRTAGWAAAAVLGPISAALFAGTTVWTAARLPASPSTGTASTAGPATVGGDLQQVLDDDTARVAALEQLVATLRGQAAQLAPEPTGPGAAARSAPRPAAPPARATTRPPTAAPPAVHAVTGASSAAKGAP